MQKVLASLGIALVAVFVVAGIGVGVSGTARNLISVRLWDRTSTLTCDNGILELQNEQIAIGGTVVQVRGDCHAKLTDCQLSGSTAVDVRDSGQLTINGGEYDGSSAAIHVHRRGTAEITDARLTSQHRGLDVRRGMVTLVGSYLDANNSALYSHGDNEIRASGTDFLGKRALDVHGGVVVIEGGSLSGSKAAIYASGAKSNVTVNSNTHIDGRTIKRSSARVETNAQSSAIQIEAGIEEQQKALEAERAARYSAQACDGLVACYEASGFVGSVSATITMTVDGHGKATKFTATGVPPRARPCVNELAATRELKDFSGSGGKLVCSFKGRFGGKDGKLKFNNSFTPSN